MPIPAVYRSGPTLSDAKQGSVLPVFQGSSTTYSADEFLKRFNDLSSRAELTGEEKFVKVFEYVDSSLEGVMSIIRTCSYNDWATFERMFRTAYYTESQGLGYVRHIIKTFKDETPGFGIHIFLECFFTYTATLCKQGVMSPGQRFSMLTSSLPPTYVAFLRKYFPEAKLWLSGLHSNVPTSAEMWDRLISLTKQYAVDQHNFRNERRASRNMELQRNGAHKIHSAPSTKKDKKPDDAQTDKTLMQDGSPNSAKCRHCGSRLPSLDSLEHAFHKAAQDNENSKNTNKRFSLVSVSSSALSPSIMSTPSEYLHPQSPPDSGTPMTSEEAASAYHSHYHQRDISPEPVTPPHQDDRETPTPEKKLKKSQSMSAQPHGHGGKYGQALDSNISEIDKSRSKSESFTSSPILSYNPRPKSLTKELSPRSDKNFTEYVPSQNMIFMAPCIDNSESSTPRGPEFLSSHEKLSSPFQASFSLEGSREYKTPEPVHELPNQLPSPLDTSRYTTPPAPLKINTPPASHDFVSTPLVRQEIQSPTLSKKVSVVPADRPRNSSPLARSSFDASTLENSSVADHKLSRSSTDSNATKSSSKKKYDLGDKERRVWELFLRANQKVRPAPSGEDKKFSVDDESMLDEDIFDIDGLIAEQLEDDDDYNDDDDDDDCSSTCSSSSVESFQPEIPVDIIMSQFADPALTKERETQLVAKYADVLTCYKMAEFVAYPESLLKHVFEIVLRYTYSTLED